MLYSYEQSFIIRKPLTQWILSKYYSFGKYAAEITSTVTPLDNNRVAIRIDVSEGIVAKIKKINILGNRKILVLLAGQEQITDNKAVTQLTKRFDFIDVVTIKEAQHEILIEKEDIRVEALSLMHKFPMKDLYF